MQPGCLTSKSLRSEARPVATLENGQRQAMWELFEGHFRDCNREVFQRDLDQKEVALLLWRGHELVGFSSLGTLELEDSRVYFSGDTLVGDSARSQAGLCRLWAEQVFRLAARSPAKRHFWYLICSGYRTYRFLPLFFQSFYPRFDRPTPPIEGELLQRAGRALYGDQFQQGLIRLQHPTPLRDSTVPRGRLNDPHVRFFLEANPGHTRGDELACLTEVVTSNLTRAGRRMLE